MEAFELIILTFGSLYCFLIIAFFYAFRRSAKNDKSFLINNEEKPISHTFSIIVAMRNESENIGLLISDLKKQKYNHSDFEIILVDDESNDDSLAIAERLLSEGGISFKLIESSGGKKKALFRGINESKNEIILFTDADCRIKSSWISAFNIFFSKENLLLISGPVVFEESRSTIQKLFCLEFSSLIVSGAAAIELGISIMINGANFAVRRRLIEEMGGKVYNSGVASGDDVFLMSETRKKYGASSIGFLNSKKAVVSTKAPKNFKSFVNQRIRWTSKSKHYNDKNIITIALLVFGINLLLVVALSLALFIDFEYFKAFLLLFFVKSFLDFALLRIFSKQFGNRNHLIYLLPLQLLYPIYIVIIGIFGQFLPFVWKGRKGR